MLHLPAKFHGGIGNRDFGITVYIDWLTAEIEEFVIGIAIIESADNDGKRVAIGRLSIDFRSCLPEFLGLNNSIAQFLDLKKE